MKNKDLFLKNLSDYLDIDLSEFDKKRIEGYLDEYVDGLPKPKELPPITIVKKQIVYRYINDGVSGRTKVRDFEIMVSPQDVISIVSKYADIPIDLILSKRRNSDIVIARHIAIYLIRKECHRTWKITGNYFHKDHTTAIHSFNHVENMLKIGDQRYIKLLNQVVPNLPEPIKQTA